MRSRLPRGGLGPIVKRGLDISLGLAMGVLAVPLMLAIAAAIYVDSPGPVLFRATRVGRHGRPFAMYKFRTMVKDAEERLQELTHLNLAQGMTKIPDDPRVTRVGRWLRRFSLDELPQIANVVAGHMSLVGPRPHDTHELPAHGLEKDPRLSVRPGLTGLWQISARSDPDIANRVHYDLRYVSRWSLLLDAKILAKTLPVVMMGKGGLVDTNGPPTEPFETELERFAKSAHRSYGVQAAALRGEGLSESSGSMDASARTTQDGIQKDQSSSADSGTNAAAMPVTI